MAFSGRVLPGLQQNNPDSYGFFPGALIDGPGTPVSYLVGFGNLYPFDRWRAVWILKNKAANSPPRRTRSIRR